MFKDIYSSHDHPRASPKRWFEIVEQSRNENLEYLLIRKMSPASEPANVLHSRWNTLWKPFFSKKKHF